MENYKELEVWRKTVNLVTEIYKITKTFPQEERYGIVPQIQRAAVSIPANIAEGWGRGSTKEYLQFLRIARGSLMELETHLIIAQKLNYIQKDVLTMLQQEVEGIGKMINSLIRSLMNK
ncbi:four helix bundle protein [bacterium]|nr:four helix bundle protein [bacterium]MBU1599091.1 four helix bundle protein [bacterium]MBU2462022.1 four helix bundle protein [bacterium]